MVKDSVSHHLYYLYSNIYGQNTRLVIVRELQQLCWMVSFPTICGINGTFIYRIASYLHGVPIFAFFTRQNKISWKFIPMKEPQKEHEWCWSGSIHMLIKHAVYAVLTIRCTSINYDHLHVHLDHLTPIINASNVIGEV